ncbi:MAG TPA: hypothetical protein DHV26_03245 [Cytophagales bacterium]|nr:hypothetical protein [Cytophagales bacterium]
MRIIFISKNHLHEETIRNNLKDLSEKDSVKFLYSFDEADRFLNEQIVKHQTPVDLIITEDNIYRQRASAFQHRIKEDRGRTYSNRDFNLNSVPVILIVDENENRRAFSYDGFSDTIDNIGIDRLHKFIPEMISTVKTWRRQVLDELDNLGIRNNSGSIDYTYYFSTDRNRSIETKILSESFRQFPRKLRYEWIEFNEEQIEKAVDEYIKELKRASRLNRKNDEKKFHKLFNKYSFLLKRDNYTKQWYEPRMHYNEDNYWEPDYALQPNFNHRTDLSIVEIKLPNEKFITKSKFHPKPYKKILDHIFQVNDYKEFLESDKFQDTIRRIYGFVPTRIEYNILVGRLDDKMNSLSVFNRRMRQMNALHINFITYDELLDYQVKFMERMKLLNIK